MRKAGVSCGAVGRRLGISPQAVSQQLTGVRRLHRPVAEAAEALIRDRAIDALQAAAGDGLVVDLQTTQTGTAGVNP
jgi:DNA-binding transcriptional regulator YdaS (Cro superfamily)